MLGPRYSSADVDTAIAGAGERIRVRRFSTFEDTCKHAALLIAQGKVIAWYRGRMEFGPRALGHRSILADPSRPEMRDHINAAVKMREAFRPFAPAVIAEAADVYFDLRSGQTFPFMIFTVSVREEFRPSLRAVTHVDGSARLQTVSREDLPDFHMLLCCVGEATGRPIVLNTSFNVKGQPIVNTPSEAIETFLSTGVDFLFLEDNCIDRIASYSP
jgi:carbamoyltransferase